jgi:transposase
MTLYCGIDLHSNNSVISLIDETDRLVSERRLDNDLATIEQHLQPYQDETNGVVVESTYNWYWLVDGLIERGYPVHLANTLAIQQYNGLKYTNDETDARFLGPDDQTLLPAQMQAQTGNGGEENRGQQTDACVLSHVEGWHDV